MSDYQYLIELLECKFRDGNQISQFFLDFPFINNFNDTQSNQFANRLAQYIQYKIYYPLETVIEIGKPVNALYFFMSGCLIRQQSKKDKNQIEISEKQALGEEAFVTRQSSKYTFIAIKECLICYVLKEDFYKVVKKRKLAMSLINTLLQYQFFQEVSPNFLEQIIQRSSTVNYQNHQIVYDENEISSSWFIIIKGSFELKFQHNNKYQPLVILVEGNFFGELEIIKKIKRKYRAECVQNDSEVLEINTQLFQQLLQKNTQFSSMIQENVENRLKHYQNLIITKQEAMNDLFNCSPKKPKYTFKSNYLRITKYNNMDDQTVDQLYSERSRELKNLLNYRMKLIQKENQVSVSEKIQQKNPRLKQFLEKLNKIRNLSNDKLRNKNDQKDDIQKSHRKLNTEIALPSARNTPGYLKSTFYSPTNTTTSNLYLTSPKTNKRFYKLLFH